MINREKLRIGITASFATILIYLDQQQCRLIVILLSIFMPLLFAKPEFFSYF
ncbi:MAG: hypothetical protein IC227_00045 [Enterococcus lacertideformus]|uniref:Uncharacterized protein n=1 Tax=Enterococcus lacertideformus TaxID=2771493 RepID=A0A931AWQ9_9ENTE|nr:hypothetical protein [Enterococcus lacertideformus]